MSETTSIINGTPVTKILTGFDYFCGDIFWNYSLLVDNTWPQFSSCFCETVVIWTPCGFFWLFAPCFMLQHRSKENPLPFARLNAAKMLCGSGLVLLSLVRFLDRISRKQIGVAGYVGDIILLLTMFASTLMTQWERRQGLATSSFSFVFWIIKLLIDIIPLYTLFLLKINDSNLLEFTIFLLMYLLVIQLVLLYSFTESASNLRRGYRGIGKKTCPETTASFLSKLTFAWLLKLIITGYKRDLQISDFWDLNPRDKSETLVPVFEELWTSEVKQCMLKGLQRQEPAICYRNHTKFRKLSIDMDERSRLLGQTEDLSSHTDSLHVGLSIVSKFKSQPSLYRVLWKQFKSAMMICIFQKIAADLFLAIGPLLLGELINVVTNHQKGREWIGYVLALGLLISGSLRSIFFAFSMYRSWLLGMHFKTVLISAIYNKSLRLSNESKKLYSHGEIVNLMSVDTQRVQDFMTRVFYSLTTPFQIVISLVIIYFNIGISVLAGFSILLLLVPLNAYVSGLQRVFQEKSMSFKDSRIKLVNEILNGIKILKLYAWEPSFERKVASVRGKEILYLLKIATLYLVTGICWNIAPFLVTLGTFASFVLSQPGAFLDPSKVFVTLSLFNTLRTPMDMLSTIIAFTVQAKVSLKRINSFLCIDEMDTSIVSHVTDPDVAVIIESGSFSWGVNSAPTLRNLNLKVMENQLVAIVGQVGAGKSSLINAILGEMDKAKGFIAVKGSIAYVAQQAWIQNATVRDNILFSQPYEDDRYKATIKACQLEHDFDILTAGDMTEIGEKGINLSGGQKQRVSLARAVYSDSDVYLLDDPLSAVDSHVGKAIFDSVFGHKGLLRNKTRILVTHGVHWLPFMDVIVMMMDGHISETGNYAQLMKHDGPFAHFLSTYFKQIITRDDEDDDLEVLEMTEKILNEVEAVTSDGATSGDEIREHLQRKKSRAMSITSLRPSNKERIKETVKLSENIDKGQLILRETMETGKVSKHVYWAYIKAAGMLPFMFAVFCFGIFHAFSVGGNILLSKWTDDPLLNNQTLWGSQTFLETNHTYLLQYGILGVAQMVFLMIYNYFYWTRMVYAGRKLHNDLITNLFHAPMTFFETTPIGRILNRISRDIETVDTLLPLVFRDFMATCALCLVTLVVIIIQTPLIVVVFIPITVLYIFIQRVYIASSRQIKRIESVTRSPIFSHFGETLSGTATIRAYCAIERFIWESKVRVDSNQTFFFASTATLRWLQMNLDGLANLVIFCAAVFELLTDYATGGGVGLSLSYALQISSTLTFMVRMVSDLETNIVSVERIREYSSIDTEAEWILNHRRPLPNWPVTGNIVMNDYQTRYRPGLDLVLKNVTCKIYSGEKIGIVGRTGAGKSSLTVALFRLIEGTGGVIIIDGINIADIGLHDLRSRLTILPQDPVLFTGSLRFNLDPFDQYTDEQIWQALERAHLKSFVMNLRDKLHSECGEDGQNLSVGQRQLVCLARTLLRHTKILILDEATAAVDMKTDALIQETIRMAFYNCTIITVAHRLNTVMDYNKIMVLDAGRIKEFDTPQNLLGKRDSLFYAMAKDAGLV